MLLFCYQLYNMGIIWMKKYFCANVVIYILHWSSISLVKANIKLQKNSYI